MVMICAILVNTHTPSHTLTHTELLAGYTISSTCQLLAAKLKLIFVGTKTYVNVAFCSFAKCSCRQSVRRCCVVFSICFAADCCSAEVLPAFTSQRCLDAQKINDLAMYNYIEVLQSHVYH